MACNIGQNTHIIKYGNITIRYKEGCLPTNIYVCNNSTFISRQEARLIKDTGFIQRVTTITKPTTQHIVQHDPQNIERIDLTESTPPVSPKECSTPKTPHIGTGLSNAYETPPTIPRVVEDVVLSTSKQHNETMAKRKLAFIDNNSNTISHTTTTAATTTTTTATTATNKRRRRGSRAVAAVAPEPTVGNETESQETTMNPKFPFKPFTSLTLDEFDDDFTQALREDDRYQHTLLF